VYEILLQLVPLSAGNQKVAFSVVSVLLHMWEELGSNPIPQTVLTKDFVGISLFAAKTVVCWCIQQEEVQPCHVSDDSAVK
jgi:hypothetical protein